MAKRAQRIFLMASAARPSRPTVMASAAMDCRAVLAVTGVYVLAVMGVSCSPTDVPEAHLGSQCWLACP
jgi:hypothetical protein